MTTLYAKLDDQGRVVQESVRDDLECEICGSYECGEADDKRREWLTKNGYVHVLAVRAAGVEEIRKRIAWERKHHPGDSYADLFTDALRVLGLEEEP